MGSLRNLLKFLYENWAFIVAIISFVFYLGERVFYFYEENNNTKFEIAQKQIYAIVLQLVSEAEIKYSDIKKSGAIKRSWVIAEIYKKYPILARAVNQQELTDWIDERIDEALIELRKILSSNITNINKNESEE